MSASQKDRTTRGKTYNLVRKRTKPPIDENGWQALTADFMESDAFRTLSGNAYRALFRLMIEHVSHGALSNGRLVVTHTQFIDYGVTGEYVADATGELEFKGIVRVKRGKAGDGTSHPNTYRLTFTGDFEGAAATNEWRRFTMAKAKEWSTTVRKQLAEQRGKLGRKKKTSLRNPEMPPLGNSEMREAS
ncbi:MULTISPECIES: hypothetical protein [unclassified Mesorhizobium]|uniref:hypothetical protein n=1 Tax=unclassified Mesorhizobium TaxID=325217 RepID=UPI000FCBF3C5|nr:MULTISPECIES: hypothetical protein [unclassified Mesorhizobium]RUX97252.1 hypothetical protein EN993_04365 [Mesorhizobium sp. M7D.F.Ca.US.004.01.2.1]RVA35048.1 hypothetical protein EN935_05085 [Mesorhizobium sp. M7D.F.Ca.US.004.03.1.1]